MVMKLYFLILLQSSKKKLPIEDLMKSPKSKRVQGKDSDLYCYSVK